MGYYYGEMQRDHDRHLLGKSVLLVVGLLIGLGLGLYVAVRTLPLPSTSVNYIVRP